MASNQWIEQIHHLSKEKTDFVVVTVIETKGSTPAPLGRKMIVTQRKNYGSVGGGRLEFLAIEKAQTLLKNQSTQVEVEQYKLGPHCGQCCAGAMRLCFELSLIQPSLVVFGAGHIGQALVPILAQLPFTLNWVDSRKALLDDLQLDSVTQHLTETPEDVIEMMPANSYYLVMTHNHQLDFDLVRKILDREDSYYLGLIGSKGKFLKFSQRLIHRGYNENRINHIQCPMGIDLIQGKNPMEIAVSIACELILHYQKHQAHKVRLKSD